MTPRERIQALLAGKAIDRIPNGLGATETTGLHVLAYEKLKRVLGVYDPRNRMYTCMANAVFELPVLQALESDMVLVSTRMCPSRLWGPGTDREWRDLEIWDTKVQVANDWRFRKDTDGSVYLNDTLKCPPGGFFFDPVPTSRQEQMAENTESALSPDDFHPPHELPEESLVRIAGTAKWLYENTEYSLVLGESIQDFQLFVGGVQAWWMRMLNEPQACHDFLGKACDAALSQLKQLDQAVGQYCDVMHIAHDMGDIRGVIVGANLWREIYKPHYKRLFTEWHNITSMKPCLHSCGAVYDIIEDLIECGLSIIDPVQVSGAGMDAESLNAAYGGRIVLYGGSYDCVCLPQDTSDDVVYETVKANILSLSRGGKYIFAGVHNLPANLPESHLCAMLAAYGDCRDGA